jgi:hypothetical protein
MLITFLRAIPFLALLSAVGYGYHWMVLEHKDGIISDQIKLIEELRLELVSYKFAQAEQQETIEELERFQAEQRQSILKLTNRSNTLARERDEYMSIFRRHDLTKLSVAKPGLIEPRINSGTSEVFKKLEHTTKELTHDETTDRFDNFIYRTD